MQYFFFPPGNYIEFHKIGYIYWIKIKRKSACTQYSVHKQRIHLLNDLYFVLHLLVSI